MKILYTTTLTLLAAGTVHAVIIGTDFTNRTVAGSVASTITYTLDGVNDPGDLTVIENEANGQNDGTSELNGLFDTGAAAGFFAPDLNVDNEDGWYVDVPLAFAPSTTSLSITTLDFSIDHFNNSGGDQTNNTPRSDWRAEIIGSSSGVKASDTKLDLGGSAGPYPDVFTLTSNLDNSETWTLRIYSDYTGGAGNNAGLDSFSLNGTAIPEPSSLLIVGLSGIALCLCRRRR